MRSYILLTAVFSLFVSPAFAQDLPDTPLTESQFRDLSSICAESSVDAVFFSAAARTAKSTIDDLCSGEVRSIAPSDLLAAIIEVTEKLRDDARNINVPWSVDEEFQEIDLEAFAQLLVNEITAYKTSLDDSNTDGGVPSISFVTQTIDGPANLTHGDFVAMPTDQAACDAAVAAAASGRSCNDYLEEFERIYTSISRFYSSLDATPAWRTLQQLDQDWTRFMEATVDQTPLELLWNGYWFRRSHGSARSLVGPPRTQQILLKPYVAGDYLGEAPDGSQLNETVVLDLWGVKRWDSRGVPWYRPLGFSVHTAYSDRPTVEDWGIGLSIHFSEANTLGVTSFDGEIGVFLSFDLWKNATDAYNTAEDRVNEFRMKRDEFRALIGAATGPDE